MKNLVDTEDFFNFVDKKNLESKSEPLGYKIKNKALFFRVNILPIFSLVKS
jgi:hypothetical protein